MRAVPVKRVAVLSRGSRKLRSIYGMSAFSLKTILPRDLLEYRGVAGDPKLPEPPKLPQRAAIYIAPDGTVHFGALFSDLVPVAKALNAAVKVNANPNVTAARCSES
jgi:hypothetical protein